VGQLYIKYCIVEVARGGPDQGIQKRQILYVAREAVVKTVGGIFA
jgi:hypothetical protein